MLLNYFFLLFQFSCMYMLCSFCSLMKLINMVFFFEIIIKIVLLGLLLREQLLLWFTFFRRNVFDMWSFLMFLVCLWFSMYFTLLLGLCEWLTSIHIGWTIVLADLLFKCININCCISFSLFRNLRRLFCSSSFHQLLWQTYTRLIWMMPIMIFKSKIFLDNNTISWINFDSVFMNKTIEFIEIIFKCFLGILNNLLLQWFAFSQYLLFLFVIQWFWFILLVRIKLWCVVLWS